jgi:PelA/Pel-15E family pectate lyase
MLRSLLLTCAMAVMPMTAISAVSPSLGGFDDAVHHWQNRHGTDYARYGSEDVTAIADNILLLQHDNGGWIENRDPARILSAEEKAAAVAEKASPDFSFDNRNIYTQVAYLMAAHEQTGREDYRNSALKGLDLILSQQMTACGGWPHTVPAKQSYHPKLTIADEVTSGNLHLLRLIKENAYPFGSIDEIRRKQSSDSVARGEACLLRLQVRQQGQLTGWAGQYDPMTLAPSGGRSFELPAIVSQETAAVLRYLMTIPDPSPEVIASIEGAVAWLKRSRIDGMRLETFTLPAPIKYDYHTATTDRRLVADPSAPPLWARFYDLKDNTVVLANRDGKRVAAYADIHPERRSGYSWYGEWAAHIINVDYPAWRARTAKR